MVRMPPAAGECERWKEGLRAVYGQDRKAVGHPSGLQRKEVMPMAEFLVNVIAAVVAGVLVALIARLFGLNK